jgi:hypothetical protein
MMTQTTAQIWKNPSQDLNSMMTQTTAQIWENPSQDWHLQ